MTFSEYQSKHPLTKGGYMRKIVEEIRRHAFFAGTPEKKQTRSQKQNRYMFGVVYKLIADHTGYTPEEVHQLMTKEFLGYENLGEKFIKSTTRLNTKEMEEYLENVRRFASVELGCYVPLPNESDCPYEVLNK